MISVYLLLILPFVGAIVAFIAGKQKKELAFWVAEAVGMTLFGIVLWLFVNSSKPIDIPIEWFRFGEYSLGLGIYIDHLSFVMLLIATGLGLLDIHFSHDYMKEDPDQPRYYAKILFFIGGMILLVSAKELSGLFVGWEFMGLASYLLISFWHTKKDPADAGVYAFLYTKFGDIFLFGAIGLLFYYTGSLDLQTINQKALSGEISQSVSYLIAIFIFIAAIGKSGQFPLFPWLMRAMEGPTTVSALIHGATMVNSGIYIVARMFDFYLASEALIIVAAVASLSAFIGATSALVQSEIKKVLAYSTMSHLSLAFIGLGAGSLAVGMSHLTNHAVFKALLFLSAGAIIMVSGHTKDLWKFGGLKSKLFWIALFMGMGALSLSGIPPFSGFFSKDAVVASVFTNPQTAHLIAALTIIAALLSVAYIFRVWLLLFHGTPRDKEVFDRIKSPSKFWIVLPLGIMAVITLVLGFFQEELSYYIAGESLEEVHIDNLVFYILGGVFALGFVVYLFYAKYPQLRDKLSAQPLMRSIHQVLFNGYYVEKMIGFVAKDVVVGFVAKTVSFIETNIIDKAVNGVVVVFEKLFILLKITDKPTPSLQISTMTLGVVVVVSLIILRNIL